MESSAWTSERLDDFAQRIDQRFDQIDRRFDRAGHAPRDLREEMKEGFQAADDRLFRIGGGIILGMVTLVATVLARGV